MFGQNTLSVYHPSSPTLAKTILSKMEFHRPDIEGFDRKGLVDHVRPSVVKKKIEDVLNQSICSVLDGYHGLE